MNLLKKNIFLLSILVVSLFVPSKVLAEEPVVGWKVSLCMSIEQCKPIKDDDNDAIKCSGGSAHLNRLRPDTSKTLPPNSDVYLIECVKINADETFCTTADPALDIAIQPLQGHLDALRDRIDYNEKERGEVRFYDSDYSNSQIGEGFTKLTTDASGNLMLPGTNKIIKSIEWKSHNPHTSLPRNFKLWTPIKEELILPEAQDPSGLGAQQQGILTFPISTGNDAVCGGFVTYDPEGRVFDAITLDPIPNVNVTLLQSDTNTVNGTYTKEAVNKFNTEYSIVNPILTKSKDFGGIWNAPFLVGSFNFFVVDGFYKLDVSHTDYEFLDSSNQNRLSANANKIYSDIYFKNSLPIQQKGAIEHRDIPLFPKDGIGKSYPETFHLIHDTNEVLSSTKTTYVGQVSHPFAKTIIETCSNIQGIETCGNAKTVSSVQGAPNKFGRFSIVLDQSTLELGQHYKVRFEPAVLTNITIASTHSFWDKIIAYISTLSFFGTQVYAQTPSVSRTVEPIPTYLEGYAYDNQGKIIPNAIVSIYVPFASSPMIVTKADEKGHFRITSEYLPNTQYTISYSKESQPEEETKLTSSAFLSQNKEFITVEKINPYLITTRETNPRRNVTPEYIPLAQISISPNSTAETAQPLETTDTKQETSNNLFLIGGILLLLVTAAGILIGVHLYRKRMQEEQI